MLDPVGSGAPDAMTFERVSFAYGARVVFHEVSLRTQPGEMIALLGPNGAGKSTLLKLAGGVLRPRAGRVLLGRDDVRTLSRAEAARRVAVVPSEFSVQFSYTVRQLVEIGRMPHTGAWGILRSSDRAAVGAALMATGLEPLADRVFNELSGGERQRVLVAMALAQGGELLLLDEPTAHLDVHHQVEVLQLLSRLNRQRRLTVIAALHDLNLAARYFPRLVLFQRGVVADGPPAGVLDARLLSDVYGTPIQVGILRGEEHLSVLPSGGMAGGDASGDGRAQEDGQRPGTSAAGLLVHVVAGGGSGDLLMRALADAGIPFTAGPLGAGDSDHTLASRLALRCISEPPATPLSAEGLAVARLCMADAGAVVVCAAPFGPGNVALLEAALEAAQAGRPVVLLNEERSPATSPPEDALLAGVRARDFAGGRAVELYAALLVAGGQIARDPAEVLQSLHEGTYLFQLRPA